MKKNNYNHAYHNCLVYKIFNCRKPGAVFYTFEESLNIIGSINKLSNGMKQIVYLTGWQHDGHDSKYPDWSVVNPRLKREQDADAKASLLWLMEEAKQYNAVVSVHINMCDGYVNSPLWDEYAAKDLLIRNADGSIGMGGVWDGEQAYFISKTLEWRAGYGKKRIDALLDILPLSEAGTVHIDVFTPRASEYHGITREDEVEAMCEILDYWKERGIDITTEWFHVEFEGRIPMVYHLNLDENSRLKYAPDVICGGGPDWNTRHHKVFTQAPWAGFFTAPQGGCFYEEAWGITVDMDIHPECDPGQIRFADRFYLNTHAWYFMNQGRAIRHEQTPQDYSVEFSNGMASNVRKMDRYCTVSQNGRLLVDGADSFLPAVWSGQDWIAYSRNGSEKTWPLPEEWKSKAGVKVTQLFPFEEGQPGNLDISGDSVKLSLKAGQAVKLTAF